MYKKEHERYYKRYYKDLMRRKATTAIEESIYLDFWKNLDFNEWSDETKKSRKFKKLLCYSKGHYHTWVVYNGESCHAGFYDIRQAPEALKDMADYFYKIVLKGAKNG